MTGLRPLLKDSVSSMKTAAVAALKALGHDD